MLRKIAIVGANGFVGRHLVELAKRRGLDVLGIVRSKAGADLVQTLGARALQVPDLERSSTEAMVGPLSGTDGLVYTASVSSSREGVDRVEPAGLINVLNACQAAGVPKVAFFSGLGIAHYGMNPFCTNSYFLGKMAGEVALFRSDLAVTVFRPSYIFGGGDEFLSPLIARIAGESVIEIPGDGGYRLQPVSVVDAARAVLGALDQKLLLPRVVDLVGPEILTYRALVERTASIMGRVVEVRERSVEEARNLARASGYFGLRPNDLACLLCDEVSDSKTIEALAGQKLEALDAIIAAAVVAVGPSGKAP